jgi:integrase
VRLEQVTVTDVDRWRQGHDWGPATANRKLGELRGFLAWARARGHLPAAADPTLGRRPERVPVQNRLRIPVDDWSRLLDAAPHPLERALVACGPYLMARASELRTIQLRHVDLPGGTIEVYRHKVKRPDIMPICAELDEELRRWLSWYGTRHALAPEMYLLPSRDGHHNIRTLDGRLDHLDPSAPLDPYRPPCRPHRNVQSVLRRAGYPHDSEGGHTLRRSAARAYYDDLCATGYDGALRRVQAMLDHSNTIVTESYLGLSLDKEARNRDLAGRPMFARTAATGRVTDLASARMRRSSARDRA